MYIELIEKIAKKECPDWERVHAVINDGMERLEQYDPRFYEEVMDNLCSIAYHISDDKAKEIVRSMRPYGEKWTMETIESFLRSKRNAFEIVSWYLVMNMMYNDYRSTASMVGMSEDTEFYYSMSKDFIEDEDAKKHKVEKYFLA